MDDIHPKSRKTMDAPETRLKTGKQLPKMGKIPILCFGHFQASCPVV